MDTYKIERLFHLLMERLDRHEKILDDLLYRSQRQSAGPEEGTECKLYNGERLYDNQDLCLMLQVSKRSLQRYRDEGRIPFSLMGRTCRYRLTDVERMMKDCSISGNAERIGELHRQYMVRTGKKT